MSTSFAGAEMAAKGGARPLNFDRLARLYRWMEWFSFGPYLWRARCTFLAEAGKARRALVLGDGDGRFTAALLRRNPQVRLDAIDVSEAMLRSLRRRAGAQADRVGTVACDVREWSPQAGAEYDLVVSHFLLDCLTTAEVGSLAERIRPSLAPGAMWMVSEFAIPAGAFGRLVARPVVASLYLAFGILTGLPVRRLPEWRSALRDAGFVRARKRRILQGLLVSEMWRGDGAG